MQAIPIYIYKYIRITLALGSFKIDLEIQFWPLFGQKWGVSHVYLGVELYNSSMIKPCYVGISKL